MPLYALNGVAPELPPDGEYWIAPDAVLIGKVRLKKNASVWFGSVLRGDNDWITLGENSNIQDMCVVHADPGQPVTIGDWVTIGHRAILHSTIVGDRALIGMGAVLLNRAAIGDGCLVGAGALVTEGKVFGRNQLILGSPARVMRDLKPEESASILRSSEIYVANARRYATGLEPL